MHVCVCVYIKIFVFWEKILFARYNLFRRSTVLTLFSANGSIKINRYYYIFNICVIY